MDAHVGVDLGATTIRAVVGGRRGDVVARRRTPTPDTTAAAVTGTVLDAVCGACADAGVDPSQVVAAGVGAAGPLDPAAGVVRPTNLPVGRVAVVDPLADLLDVDAVRLHNDATAGVIGERARADAPANAVYLTVSTGIGAGVVVDGHVLSGRDGNAAEVGHVVLDPDRRLDCRCGGAGCWEAYCAGSNVPRFARFCHAGEETVLPVEAGERERTDRDAQPAFDAADVFDAAPDDAFAARVVERLGRWNALGVAAVVHAYAPDLVSVGGGVALGNPERLLDPVRERLPDLVATDVPAVRVTPLGDDAVLRGALASAVEDGTGRLP